VYLCYVSSADCTLLALTTPFVYDIIMTILVFLRWLKNVKGGV